MAAALLVSPVSSIFSAGWPEHVVTAASAVDKSSSNMKPIWMKTVGNPNRMNTQATLIKNDLYYTTGKLIKLETDSGRTLASVHYKGTPLPTLISQDVLVVQHGGQISGVKMPMLPSNSELLFP